MAAVARSHQFTVGCTNVICVLGMHRSGTSLLTRILSLLGVHLGSPEHLLGPSSSNPKGYWEHQQFIAVNDEILRRLGGSWYSLPQFPDGWEKSADFEDLQRDAYSKLFAEFDEADIWGWKDPRTCLTLPFWQQVLPRMKYVIVIRNPFDVVSSLKRRDGFSNEQGLYLWFAYLQVALRYSADHPRMFVLYEELLNGWRDKLPTLSQFIGRSNKAEEPGVESAIGNSIDRKLQHHCTTLEQQTNGTGPSNSSSAFAIASRAYLAFKNVDLEKLDQLLQEGIDALENEVNKQKNEPEYKWLYEFDMTIQEIEGLVPADEAFLLVSWYQWGADKIIAGRRAVPFVGRDGQYLGPPNDDQAAINELERERRAGASFIVFGSPAFWWLEYYSGFRSYLHSNFRCVLQNDRLIIFDLRRDNS